MTADPIQEQPLPAEDIKESSAVFDSDAITLDASKTNDPFKNKETDAETDGLKNLDKSQDRVKNEKSSDEMTRDPFEENELETEKEGESQVPDVDESDSRESKSGETEKLERNSKDNAKLKGAQLNGDSAEPVSFSPGTVVLAKVKGFPAWPGIVSWKNSVQLRDAN